jgi:drug/metabolite transporter (DMT)-like permease
MSFYAFAWIACLASASTIIITKLTSKYSIKNPWFFNFLWAFVILLFTVPLALFNHAGIPKDWPPIIIAGIFAALWNVFYIQSMYKIDVSTLSPLFNFRLVFALVLGSIFFQEHLTTYQFILFLVIFVGGIFASFDERLKLTSFFKPTIGIGLLAMLFLAINNASIKVALVKNDLWTANLWMGVITLLVLTPTIYLFQKEASKLKIGQFLPVLGMGVLQTVTNIAANIAYSKNLTITSLIMAVPLSMIMAFLFSVFAPTILEKHSPKIYAIRFTAAIVMIFAALQLSH